MVRLRAKLISLFLLALTVLMVEVCFTRIFSVLSWFHFAYMIIGLALLGFGAAGSYLTVSPRFIEKGSEGHRLGRCAWLFGVTLIGATVVVSKIRFYPEDIVLYGDYSNALSLLILYLVMGVPFFFAGICIGRMVALAGDSVNLFYFADLTGAGIGALLSLVVINYFGAVAGIFLGSAFASLAAFLLAPYGSRRVYGLTTAVTFALAVFTGFADVLPFYYPPSKPMFRNEHTVEYSRWHVVGKIDITSPVASYWSFGGALSQRYKQAPPLVRGIYQDGSAPTGIMLLEESPEKVPILGEYLQGVAYVVRPAKSVLVIGVGGGIDGLIALHNGATDVLGVDLNPVTVGAVEKRFRNDCPALWRDGRFKILVSEGRHYLSRSQEKFDVIQLSGVDTFTALSSGAYVLSEDFLYTAEAMHAYWEHLKDDGILSFSRWLFDPPRETLRLVTTQLKMLDEIGILDPHRYFMIVSGSAKEQFPWAEVLLKRSPFTKEEVNGVTEWAGERRFDVIFDPFTQRSNTFDIFIRAGREARKQLIADYRFNVAPTTDDGPFFFQFYRWRSLLELVGGRGGLASSKGGYGLGRIPLGLIILAMSLLQMLALSLAFILAPLQMRQRLQPSRAGRAGMFLYFAALGLGFIFIEITLLQKFSVFVGGPVYSMAITLAAVLVFSGFGSFIAKLFCLHPGRWLFVVILVLITVIGGEVWFVNQVMGRLMGLSLAMRWVTTVLVVAPLGMLMGMPFPTGLRILEQLDESMRPWAWGVNACATVVGSMLCVLVSIHAGFTSSIIAAAGIYIAGGLGMSWAAWRNRRPLAETV